MVIQPVSGELVCESKQSYLESPLECVDITLPLIWLDITIS